jgi:predicted nucleotidyltransferase
MAKKQTIPRYAQPYRYASPNIPVAAIRRFARRIAERFQPDKIILFGSYAHGKPHEESDVDLLVIMRTEDAIDQSIRIKMAFKRLFSLDLIVRTPRQIERGLKDDNWFLREIMEKGKVLYEARDRQVGSQSRTGLGSGTQARGRNPASTRRRVFSLPASGGKVPQGTPSRKRTRGAKDSSAR